MNKDKLFVIGLCILLWTIIELFLINFFPINLLSFIVIFFVSIGSYVLAKFVYENLMKALEEEIP